VLFKGPMWSICAEGAARSQLALPTVFWRVGR